MKTSQKKLIIEHGIRRTMQQTERCVIVFLNQCVIIPTGKRCYVCIGTVIGSFCKKEYHTCGPQKGNRQYKQSDFGFG